MPIHIYPLGVWAKWAEHDRVRRGLNGYDGVVDCGLVFPDSEMYGVWTWFIPDFTFVVQNKDSPKSRACSSPTATNHIGNIPYLLQKLICHLQYPAACGLIRNKRWKSLAWQARPSSWRCRSQTEDPSWAAFTVEPIHVPATPSRFRGLCH